MSHICIDNGSLKLVPKKKKKIIKWHISINQKLGN